MSVTLYSTGCSKCNILKKKLEEKEISFELSNDINEIVNLGFKFAPVLQINEKYLNFSEAINWLKDMEDK